MTSMKMPKNSEELSLSLSIDCDIAMILPGMTVLAARRETNGEVSIIADGCGGDPKNPDRGCVLSDEWKTARLNDHLAVGFGGGAAEGNIVLSRLFGHKEWEQYGAKLRLVRLLEEQHLDLPQASWRSTRRTITEILEDIAIPGLGILMVGIDASEPRICVWHEDYKWIPQELTPPDPTKNGATIAIGPGGRSLPVEALSAAGVLLETRAQRAMNLYADIHPGLVNAYTTIRRSSRNFALEIYDEPSDAPSNSEAPDS